MAFDLLPAVLLCHDIVHCHLESSLILGFTVQENAGFCHTKVAELVNHCHIASHNATVSVLRNSLAAGCFTIPRKASEITVRRNLIRSTVPPVPLCWSRRTCRWEWVLMRRIWIATLHEIALYLGSCWKKSESFACCEMQCGIVMLLGWNLCIIGNAEVFLYYLTMLIGWLVWNISDPHCQCEFVKSIRCVVSLIVPESCGVRTYCLSIAFKTVASEQLHLNLTGVPMIMLYSKIIRKQWYFLANGPDPWLKNEFPRK